MFQRAVPPPEPKKYGLCRFLIISSLALLICCVFINDARLIGFFIFSSIAIFFFCLYIRPWYLFGRSPWRQEDFDIWELFLIGYLQHLRAKWLIEQKLKSLTVNQAAQLTKFQRKYVFRSPDYIGPLWLELNSLTSIDKEVACELAKYSGQSLSLGLTSISKEVACELAKYRGQSLSLGLTSISKEVAQELVKFKGSLFLDGLTSIDKDVAHELGMFHAPLDLSSLTSIDKDVALELGRLGKFREYFDGPIVINDECFCELNKLRIDECTLGAFRSSSWVIYDG